MKRRLSFNITLNSTVGKKQVDMNTLNAAIARLIMEQTDGTDEDVEINMYVSTTKKND